MEMKKRVKFTNPNKTQFYKILKQRIDAYFAEKRIDPLANGAMVWKTVLLLSLYLLPFVVLYVFSLPVWAVLICFVLAGFGVAGSGMSVMHDANHGSYSHKKWVNTLLGGTLNILGGFDVNWRYQHNILHHTYTNITHVGRLSPSGTVCSASSIFMLFLRIVWEPSAGWS